LAADIQVFRLGRLRWTNEAGPNCWEGFGGARSGATLTRKPSLE